MITLWRWLLVNTNIRDESLKMSSKYSSLNIRADSPWLTGLDDLAILLRLGNRTRVVDLAVELLASMAEMKMPPRVAYPEHPGIERFTAEDKARLLENASTVLAREVHGAVGTTK